MFRIWFSSHTVNCTRRTLSVDQVATSIFDQSKCSSTISDETCSSGDYLTSDEWSESLTLKTSLTESNNGSLCVTECDSGCGPLYLYITDFYVLPDGEDKSSFAKVQLFTLKVLIFRIFEMRWRPVSSTHPWSDTQITFYKELHSD